ncbi:lantibiotic ABC transporter permease [Spirochaetia bacterium]|nr:lantibiotic ABC transporter permease [Spirochaetia bacterium]
MAAILEVKHVDKRFGAVHALNDVSLAVEEGETLALVGENGAGKSTLVKILTGVNQKDKGELFFLGQKTELKSAMESRNLGIAQVYQQAELIPELTVAENIFLGDMSVYQGGLLSWKTLFKKTGELLKKYNIAVNPHARVKSLNVATQQLVAIAKVLLQQPKLVVFDEPTAVLSDNEVKILFDIINKLKAEHTTIIYISHRLEEIFTICNRVAVMRDGRLITVLENKNLTKADLIMHMLGKKLEAMFPEKDIGHEDEVALELKNVSTAKVTDISLKLMKGEILGITGLVGSGRTELARAIYGLDRIKSGEIRIGGERVRLRDTLDASKRGIFLAPEDRKGEALVLIRPIRENITLSNLKTISKSFFCNAKKEKALVEKLRGDLNIKADTMNRPVLSLSGGNQQKVVVAKAITARPKILIFDEPTQGIDVGAKFEIYTLLNKLKKDGLSIIVISSEIEEVQGLCNRIVVMRQGKIAGEINGNVEDTESILNLMYRSEAV